MKHKDLYDFLKTTDLSRNFTWHRNVVDEKGEEFLYSIMFFSDAIRIEWDVFSCKMQRYQDMGEIEGDATGLKVGAQFDLFPIEEQEIFFRVVDMAKDSL